MDTTWKNCEGLVEAINATWRESEDLRVQWEKARNDAARSMQEMIAKMTERATLVYETDKIKVIPVIKDSALVGVQVWVGDICHAYGEAA